MSDVELDKALAELEDTRKTAEEELRALCGAAKRRWNLESDKEDLLRSYAAMTPDALDALTSEERHQVYKMLRLKVMVHLDGALEVSDALYDCFASENQDERLAVAQDQVDLHVACAVIALQDLVTFADEISQREPVPQEAGLTTT